MIGEIMFMGIYVNYHTIFIEPMYPTITNIV